MRDFDSASSVVVGIDGSCAATQAAIWAADEAVSRDIPLRLVYVIDPVDISSADADHAQFASGRAALHDAQHAVEATGKPIKIETEILLGKPVVKLTEESRSAAMVCVGFFGMKHACRGIGSVAAALPAFAQCPVAVIRQSVGPASPDAGSVVVEVNNDVVLRYAFAEARLRGAPLRVVASWQAEAPDDIADEKRLVRARLNRRIARWRRLYPGVQVLPTVIRGNVCQYLVKNAQSVQLFVTGIRDRACDVAKPGPVACSMLTVHCNRL